MIWVYIADSGLSVAKLRVNTVFIEPLHCSKRPVDKKVHFISVYMKITLNRRNMKIGVNKFYPKLSVDKSFRTLFLYSYDVHVNKIILRVQKI